VYKIAYGFLVFMVFTVPIDRMTVVAIPGIGTLTRIIGFTTVVIASVYILVKKKINELPIILTFMFIFILWGLITYIWSVNPSATLGRFVSNIQMLAMVWLLWQLCKTEKEILTVYQVYILGAYIAIIDMISTYYSGTSSIRISADGANPNWMTIYFAFGIPVAWYLILKGKNGLLYIINLLYIPLVMFCAVLTASRGGMITVLTGLLIIPLSLPALNTRNKTAVVIGLIVIIGLGLFKFPQHAESLEQNIDRLAGTTEAIREQDLSGRQNIYRGGLRVFSENALFGVGSAGFRFAMMEYYGWARAAHNGYLSVGVDTGIIGLLLFLGIFVIVFLPSFHIPAIERVFYVGLLLTVMMGLMPANMESNKAVWLMLAFLTLPAAYILRNGRFVLVRRL
jgi:O-antigen ligase